jgi:hypothetical protein
MAQFRGTIEGQRGQASRLGSKSSGLRVTANGWNAGVTVIASHVNGHDVFYVYATSGSGYGRSDRLIATVGEDALQDGVVKA